jgi:hypothetical protein
MKQQSKGIVIGIGNVMSIVAGFSVSSLDIKLIPKPKHKTLPIPIPRPKTNYLKVRDDA